MQSEICEEIDFCQNSITYHREIAYLSRQGVTQLIKETFEEF